MFDASHARPGAVSLSFTQLRLDENSDRAQLRVANGTSADLDVAAIGLDWRGYGSFVEDYRGTVPVGRVLDLRLTLPHPRCGHAEGPVYGVVGLAGGEVVRRPLDRSGTGFVTRIWERQCSALEVSHAVALRYGSHWHLEASGADGSPRLVGSLLLLRRGAHGPVTISSVQGTVIYDLVLRGRPALAPGEQRSATPLEIRSFRCDHHALGESSQTFDFRYLVRLPQGRTFSVLRLPPARVRGPAQRLVALTCT